MTVPEDLVFFLLFTHGAQHSDATAWFVEAEGSVWSQTERAILP